MQFVIFVILSPGRRNTQAFRSRLDIVEWDEFEKTTFSIFNMNINVNTVVLGCMQHAVWMCVCVRNGGPRYE